MNCHVAFFSVVFVFSCFRSCQAVHSPSASWQPWRLKPFFPGALRSPILSAMTPAPHESPRWTTKYFTQTLDHFSFTPLSDTSFQQKYIVWDKHWGGGKNHSPIFVYCGNEGPVEWFADNAGFIREIAAGFQALVVAVEHRYYGESMPFGSAEAAYKDGNSLAFLTTEQAIADYAILLTNLKKNLSAEHSPIVLFGGSYGGMIAAWFRLKYPHIAVGAIASSAPILQFGDTVPADTFYRIVSEDFRKEGKTCFQSIRNSWSAISAVGSTEEGLQELSKKFGMCRLLGSPEELKEWLVSAYSYLAMVDYPLPADFLMPLPAYPIREVCRAMDALPSEADLLSRISAGVNVYYNFTGGIECFDTSDDPHGMNGWNYQYCTEMTMPFASNASNSMFEPFDWDLEAVTEGCEGEFAVKPRPGWVLTHFGGKDITSVLKHFGSNIVFSNGALDPWSGGSVTESISDTVVATVIADGSHHLDLRPSTAFDPPSVIQQREFEKENIRRWLYEYYRDSGLFVRSPLSFEATLFKEHSLKLCSMAALLGVVVLLFISRRLVTLEQVFTIGENAIHRPFLEKTKANGMMRNSRHQSDTVKVLLVALLLPAVAFSENSDLGGKAVEDNVGLPVELVESNFNASLAAATTPWSLVEFYAHWCPACQHFKPHYERVSKLFMSPLAAYPDLIYVARVDCADPNQGKLCSRFDVSHYPTMLFGRPSEMATAFRKGEETVGSIEEVAQGYTDSSVTEWLSTRLEQTFELDPEKRPEVATAKISSTATVTVTNVSQSRASLHDIEEATAIAFDFIFSSLRLSPPIRRALVKVLPLLAAHHPSTHCRQGSANLLALLDDVWPQDETGGEDKINLAELKKQKICGPVLPRGYWKECKGSKPGTRGYSCGLWLLFHSLTVQLDPSEGSTGLAAILTFVEHFFGCGMCREHFVAMAKRRNMTEVATGRAAVLWLWGAHNEVNARLAEEEALDGPRGDPESPKQQWPPVSLCPQCRKGEQGSWDLSEVYKFLVGYFKHPLEDHSKSKTDSIRRPDINLNSSEEATVKDIGRVDYVVVLFLFILAILAMATMRFKSWWPAQHRRRKLSRRWGTLPV